MGRAMLSDPVHELDFDGIDLVGRIDYGGFRFEALGQGSTLGNPQPLDREIQSGLLDGTVVVTEGHGNRVISFQIQIVAANSVQLAAGEAMLFRSCSKRAILGWKPPDGWGPRTLFQAFTSSLTHDFDDLNELRIIRAYTVRLTCSPFGSSEDQIAVVATAEAPAVPVTTVMSDGTSATGWSSPATASAQPTVSSGVLRIAPRQELYLNAQAGWVAEATLALSAVDFSATPYISLDIKPRALMRLIEISENQVTGNRPTNDPSGRDGGVSSSGGPLEYVAAYVDGSKLAPRNVTVLPDGTFRYTFVSTDASASSIRFLAGTAVIEEPSGDDYHPTGAAAGVTFDNLTRSNVAPGQSTSGRRTSLAFFGYGSARTSGSFEITHPTAGLGETLLYTSSALGLQGYEPQCRQYISSGTDTPDTATLSGTRTRSADGGVVEWNIPTAVIPAGAYLVAVRKRWISENDDSITYLVCTVSMKIGSTLYSSTELPVRPALPANTSAGTKAWDPVTPLGVVHLPQQDVPAGGSVGFVNVKLDMENGEADYDVDDIFLFHMGDDSDLTHVDCGSGTPSAGTVHNRLFVDQPSPSNPRYHLMVGTQADRSDAFDPGYPKVTARGSHPVQPGTNRMWVATVGATYPVITRRYFPAWHTHAGQVNP